MEKRPLSIDDDGGKSRQTTLTRAKRRKVSFTGDSKHAKNVKKAKQVEENLVSQNSGAIENPRLSKAQPDLILKQPKEALPVVSKDNKTAQSNSREWSLLPPLGGRYLNVDPVYSADEEHIILGTENAVLVHSMSTSTMVRSLQPPAGQIVGGFQISPTNPDHLYMSTPSGKITRWDWVSGHKSEVVAQFANIVDFDVCENPGSTLTSPKDTVFAVCRRKKERSKISMAVYSDASRSKLWTSEVILKTKRAVTDVRAVVKGVVLVALAGDFLLVGHISDHTAVPSQKPEYIWREIKLPITPTCLDILRRTPPVAPLTGSKKSDSKSANAVIDLVLGEREGSILIYNDLLNALLQSEKYGRSQPDLTPSRMHWHRSAVKAVKWSKDGNYIISGGLETVLVLWQLDTGRKELLPHLGSPICNLVVAPSGTSYAVKLGDNSAMVLSTSELKPVAVLSGLHLPSVLDLVKSKVAKSEHTPGKVKSQVLDEVSAVLHPTNPDHVLLAVPSIEVLSSAKDRPNSCFVQTYDLRAGQHVSRQALTRTNVSIINTGPQGAPITTPDVRFLKITADGKWLATIDVWRQYNESIAVLRPSQADGSNGNEGSEIFLKFWRWKDDSREWEMVARIDNPHSKGCRVLGLAHHPKDNCFATIGEDAAVRIWILETRSRISHRREGSGSGPVGLLQTWRCSRTIAVEKSVSEVRLSALRSACLGFSGDGSVLALCLPGNGHHGGMTVLVDPETGEACHCKPGLYSGDAQAVGFLGRYLIVLSSRVVVWDTVLDEIITDLLVHDGMVEPKAIRAPSLVAVNPRSGTFAVTFVGVSSATDGQPPSQPRLAVFEPLSPTPVFQSPLSYSARALLPDSASGDYVLIDTTAQIWRVSTGSAVSWAANAGAMNPMPRTGLEGIFGAAKCQDKAIWTDEQVDESGNLLVTTTARRTGKAKNLSDIFDIGPSFVLPPVETLFNEVMDFFSGGSPDI